MTEIDMSSSEPQQHPFPVVGKWLIVLSIIFLAIASM